MKALFKRFEWLLWVILGVAAVVGLWLVRTLFTKDPDAPAKLPEVPDALKKKIAKVEEQALIERVKATAEADHAREVLQEVAKEDDGKKRREQLAAALSALK